MTEVSRCRPAMAMKQATITVCKNSGIVAARRLQRRCQNHADGHPAASNSSKNSTVRSIDLVSGLSLRQVDCYDDNTNDPTTLDVDKQGGEKLDPRAKIFVPFAIKSLASTAKETLPHPQWCHGRYTNNDSSNTRARDQGFSPEEGKLYTYDNLPEGFPIKMGPGVNLSEPFQIDSSGNIFQCNVGMPRPGAPTEHGHNHASGADIARHTYLEDREMTPQIQRSHEKGKHITLPVERMDSEMAQQEGETYHSHSRDDDHCRTVSDASDDDGSIEVKNTDITTRIYGGDEIISRMECNAPAIPEDPWMSKVGKSMAPMFLELEVLEIEVIIKRPRLTYRQRAKGILEN